MIKQTAIGLNSRSEANPFNEGGFLPLITAPRYSVVDESNYQVFLDNKIQVCLPRTENNFIKNVWNTYSLQQFIDIFITCSDLITESEMVCVDTANGNIPALHEAIRKAKEIHGDKLVIMAGNVSSVESFIELATTGVDYIRVGIGEGSSCNTTSNTGVGQVDLEELIQVIKRETKRFDNILKDEVGINPFSYFFYDADNSIFYNTLSYQEIVNLTNVKIVADGISTYIKQCESKYRFNDNGYAAINKLLFAGADLVMIGGLFAQCVESAGEKGVQGFNKVYSYSEWNENRTKSGLFGIPAFETPKDYFAVSGNGLLVKYSGMSTLQEQIKYRDKVTIDQTPSLRPSKGSVKWIPVRWTLKEWLLGSENQDQPPYLMGWVNSIKFAMSYTGKTELK